MIFLFLFIHDIPSVAGRQEFPPPVAAGPGSPGHPSFASAAAGPGPTGCPGVAMKMDRGGDVVEHTITPHCIKAVYNRMCICLVILLASGVNDKAMLKAKVMPDGRSYCLDICIPDALTDPSKFLVLFRASAKAREDSGGDSNAALYESVFNEKMSTMRVSKNAPLWCHF
jgi:hypothetical protein